MGAFIGYGQIGVWANNRERDAFLDWYSTHRCQPHDSRWEYCRSAEQRWTGHCIELAELIPRGEIFEVSEAGTAGATAEFWPHVGRLLRIISQITRGEWQHSISSREANYWRGEFVAEKDQDCDEIFRRGRHDSERPNREAE